MKKEKLPEIEFIHSADFFGGEKHKMCFCGKKVMLKIQQNKQLAVNQVQSESSYYCHDCCMKIIKGIKEVCATDLVT